MTLRLSLARVGLQHPCRLSNRTHSPFPASLFQFKPCSVKSHWMGGGEDDGRKIGRRKAGMQLGRPGLRLSIQTALFHSTVLQRRPEQREWKSEQEQPATSPPATATTTTTSSSSSSSSSSPLNDSSSDTRSNTIDTKALSEDILTIPNLLTIARLLSTPLLGYLILVDEMPFALALLAASGFTDLLDGWLARRYGSATVFGSIADPAADKALMTVMVGALAYRGLIPIPLVILIIGRDLCLVLSAFLIRYQSLAPPKTLTRYWDPRLPSAKVQPTKVSKYNTFLQIILVAGCTALATFNEEWRAWWVTAKGLWTDEGQSVGNKEVLKRMEIETETQLKQQPKQAKERGKGEEEERGKEKGEWRRVDWVKKGWHSFMCLVAITTVWSGGSYLFRTGAVKVLSSKARSSRSKMMGKVNP